MGIFNYRAQQDNNIALPTLYSYREKGNKALPHPPKLISKTTIQPNRERVRRNDRRARKKKMKDNDRLGCGFFCFW